MPNEVTEVRRTADLRNEPTTTTADANVDTPDPAAEREAKLAEREKVIDAREKKFADELKKNATEKTGLGAKLSRLNELEKEAAGWPDREKSLREKDRQSARMNPKAYLKDVFGDDYYKLITDTEVNGVPPAQLIASEMEKIRAEFKSELEAREKKSREEQTQSEQRELDESRKEVQARAAAFYEKEAAKYPVFKKLGGAAQVGAMLGQRIEREFMTSGRILTEKEAADGLKAELYALFDGALEDSEFKSSLQEKLKPATVAPSSGVPGVPSSTRRTLSNSLTASTTGKAPPRRSEAERLAAAIAAGEAAIRKS